jgi:hypothetical protein
MLYSLTDGPLSEKKMTSTKRPFYKSWILWVVVIVVAGWPWVNDWAWDSAKADAKTLIAQFETKQEAHLKAPAGSPEATQAVTVEMSKLTCIAANSFYSGNWQVSVPYRGKLIQAFVWHGYGADIPSAQSVKERGCGETADGKYQFRGS